MGAPNTTASSNVNNNDDENGSHSSSHVRVVTRIRPLNKKEQQSGAKASLSCLPGKQPLVQVSGQRWFEFDAVLDGNSTQEQVYVESGAQKAVCEDLFKGFNCTILAYGQTGAGKSYSMGTAGSKENDVNAGIIPRACADLFAQIQAKCDGNAKVELSYTELYNEQIRDLLAPSSSTSHGNKSTQLRIRETLQGEVYVSGVVSQEVTSPADIGALMEQATAQRVVASTAMNAVSSRSHAICTLRIQGLIDDTTKFSAKLTLVDLAGSERIKKTGAVGARQAEGININKSLLVLGQVVSALAEKKKPPYRDSKLTRLLQDSLGGNSRTLLVACVSPADCNLDESINTLRYASRARKITNTATRNLVEHISPEEAAALKRQNVLLQQQVAELQQTIRQLTAASTTAPATAAAASANGTERSQLESPTNTITTFASSDDEDDEQAALEDYQSQAESKDSVEQEEESTTPNVPEQIDLSDASQKDDEEEKDETKSAPPKAATDVTTVPEIGVDVAEYIIQISNLKVQVAQLQGELDENKFLEKRLAELQVRYAEAQAEADSARIAASYLSNIVDELRGLKQDEIDRKQQLLQMKLKEHNVFSLVHAMLDTYRMQVNRLASEFDKSVVRAIENMGLTEKMHKSQSSSEEEEDDRSVGSMDTKSVLGDRSVDRSVASFLDGRSAGSFIDTTRSVGSFLYNSRVPTRARTWFKSKRGNSDDRSRESREPPMPWKQATDSFHSKIREIESSIKSDVESLTSNMASLQEESQLIEMDIGNKELESQYLLSTTDDTRNELVDHLSAMLTVKQV